MVINLKNDRGVGNGKGDVNDIPPRDPAKPIKPPPKSKGNLGGSPGLVTSTGGLFGTTKALLLPFYDTKNRNVSLNIIDPTNFDTEEDAFYYFPSPNIKDARAVTVHQVAIIYREIGPAIFSIGIIVYIRRTDKFVFKEVPIVISNTSPNIDVVNAPFPDMKLHTRYSDLRIDGERPQVYLRRKADSGPISIISVTIAGHTDVPEIM